MILDKEAVSLAVFVIASANTLTVRDYACANCSSKIWCTRAGGLGSRINRFLVYSAVVLWLGSMSTRSAAGSGLFALWRAKLKIRFALESPDLLCVIPIENLAIRYCEVVRSSGYRVFRTRKWVCRSINFVPSNRSGSGIDTCSVISTRGMLGLPGVLEIAMR
jgi:hypothetical protein